MNIEKILEDPKLVDIVLNSISEYVELPDEGFLAGGSVANTILGFIYEGKAKRFKVNDVDIFNVLPIKSYEDLYSYKSKGEESLQPNINLNMDILSDDYGHVFVESDGTFYRVIESTRDGLINNVTCIVKKGNGRQERYLPEPPEDNPNQVMTAVTHIIDYGKKEYNENCDIILRGFDINSCQAGIDLKTKKLYWTKPYADFLKTRQLMVDVPYTPIHTSIRLIKKMLQYGTLCYCDFEKEFQYLFQATNTDEYGKLVGKETYDKFTKYNKVYLSQLINGKVKTELIDLNKYFKLRKPLYHELPASYREDNIPPHISSPISHYNQTVIHEIDLWFLEPVKGVFNYIDVEYYGICELKRVWELLYRPRKKSHKKKIESILRFKRLSEGPLFGGGETKFTNTSSINTQNSYPTKCLIANDDYYNCDFSFNHLVEIENFFTEHRRLSSVFSKFKNIQEQYEKLRLLKSFVNKEGDWVIGILESGGSKFDITEESLYEVIEKEKLRLSQPLCEPYDLSDFKYKNYVSELVTPYDLKLEGSKMGHCVGGYSHSIENGESRIFHIEIDGIGSTLEIGLKDYNGISDKLPCFKVKQHYGRYPKKGNLTPTNKNRGIAFKLVYYLAKQNLTKDVFIESLKSSDGKKTKRNKWSKWLSDGHRNVNNNQTDDVLFDLF